VFLEYDKEIYTPRHLRGEKKEVTYIGSSIPKKGEKRYAGGKGRKKERGGK